MISTIWFQLQTKAISGTQRKLDTDLHFIDGHCDQLVEDQSDLLSLVLIGMTTEPRRNNKTVFESKVD